MFVFTDGIQIAFFTRDFPQGNIDSKPRICLVVFKDNPMLNLGIYGLKYRIISCTTFHNQPIHSVSCKQLLSGQRLIMENKPLTIIENQTFYDGNVQKNDGFHLIKKHDS